MKFLGGIHKIHTMFKSLKIPLKRSFSQEVQKVPQGSIIIQLYGDVDTPESKCLLVEHQPGRTYTAEELVLIAVRHKNIGPLAMHLFGLVTPDLTRWFPPNEEITCPENGHVRFLFRMRLKPHVKHLEGLTIGVEAFEYIFLQVRDDFVNDVLQNSISHLERERILGMGVTDVHRYGKQENMTIDKVQEVDPVRFLPKSVADSYKNLKRILLKNGFRTELKREYGLSVETRKLKLQYINGILLYMPNYAIEAFLLREEEMEIVVDPFHKKLPGIYLRNNSTTEHVCEIKDIMDISFLADQARVQINRYEGMPRSFIFKTSDEAQSFISLVDGYHRLTINFYYHLCSAIKSPLVDMLSRHRFHGPVHTEWAKDQLREHHRKTQDVNYLVRQRSTSVDLLVLIFIPQSDKDNRVTMLLINKLASGYQIAVPDEPIFEKVADLLRHYESGENKDIPLKSRLGPKMVHGTDDSGLFLCSAPHILEEAEEELQEEAAKHQAPAHQQQRSTVRIISGISLYPDIIGAGQFTEVYKGFWNKDSKNIQAVAVKQLKHGVETTTTYQALMETVHVMSFWSNNTVVSVLDICLHPFQMLMELGELGTLEAYLQNPHQRVSIQHLVTAVEQTSQALRYLQDECRGASRQVHGNIRARNILVFDHTTDNLKVKLGDPGMVRLYASEDIYHPYSLERLPWIAPELYTDLRAMTTHSDRYSFGVLLWEMFSLGDRPCLHVKPEVIKTLARSGKCLDKPKKCPTEIYKLMCRCWNINPPDRISAKEIVRDIRSISQGMDRMESRSEAQSHYTLDNVGDLPEHANDLHHQGTNDKGEHNEVSLRDEQPVSESVAGNTVMGVGVGPRSVLHSMSGSSTANSTTPLLGPDWSGTNSLQLNNDVTKPGIEHRPLPEQPGVEYILRRELLKVDEKKTLGKGYYGTVHVGLYKEQQVAVKSLNRTASHMEEEFVKEFNMMTKLKHPNIVTIIGQCPSRGQGMQMLLVMEYIENGCLRNYLKEREKQLDPVTLLKFSQQVADGMHYLSSQKIVHRDLATRNVLVGRDITMKISDFGLSRLIDPNRNYYKCHRGSAEMPLKWCAPESLLYQKFSTKSDVWSYGITVWEIFKFGAAPFLTEDRHIHTALYKGQRLAQPSNCPSVVYKQLMLRCWEYYIENRPAFEVLTIKAKELVNQAELYLKGASNSKPPADWEMPKTVVNREPPPPMLLPSFPQ